MIHILHYGIDSKLLEFLASTLEEKFYRVAGGVEISGEFRVPEECYNPLRGQFNSTCILFRLERRWITLAVVDFDIYADNLNFVFGEAELNGSRAIVSIYRLRGSRLKERLVKEATHEIGHVLGLKHCGNRRCVMSFSNSVLDVDAKSDEFCEVCRRKLGL